MFIYDKGNDDEWELNAKSNVDILDQLLDEIPDNNT